MSRSGRPPRRHRSRPGSAAPRWFGNDTSLWSEPMLGPAKPRRLDQPIAVSLEELVPQDHFYRHLEATLDLGFVREWVQRALRRAGPAEHRPGGLLQAAAGHVLRGDPLRAPADRDGQPQPRASLVPRLCPRRGPPRPLQPDPHPPAPGRRHLPALLRADRRSLPGGRPGLGPGALLRRDQGRGPTPPLDSLVPRFYHEAKTHVADLFADDQRHRRRSRQSLPAVQSPDGLLSLPVPSGERRRTTGRR